MRHPFGQFVLSVPAVSPPKLLLGSSLVAIVWEFGKDSLDNVGVLLSNSQNIINNLLTTSKSKVLHEVLWGKLTPSWPNPIQSLALVPYHLENALVPHNLIHYGHSIVCFLFLKSSFTNSYKLFYILKPSL